MTELMNEMRPLEASQFRIKEYAEQVWLEMETIMADLEYRGTATAFVMSPGFERLPDALKKFCMTMSDLTDRGI